MCGNCKGIVQHERDTVGRLSGKLTEKEKLGKIKRQDIEGMGKLAGVLL